MAWRKERPTSHGRRGVPLWRRQTGKLLATGVAAVVFAACWYGWSAAERPQPSHATGTHRSAETTTHRPHETTAQRSDAISAHEAKLIGPDRAPLSILGRRTATPHGEVVQIPIPGMVSKTHPRPAEVYLPPAWFAPEHPRLPVLVVLHGNPGAPTDWSGAVDAPRTLDAWANAHHGVAPIMVMPDTNNGDHLHDTECVDSVRGNEETYLTEDVPRFVVDRFGTKSPGQAWGVSGFSEGGACSIMLTLRHPGVFRTFLDLGGLAGPRLGDSNTDTASTVDTLFHGSRDDFLRHEPGQLLAQQRFAGLGGWFEQGGDDPEPVAAATKLASLSQKAGIDTHIVTVPHAAHTFSLWRAAFGQALGWIMRRVTE